MVLGDEGKGGNGRGEADVAGLSGGLMEGTVEGRVEMVGKGTKDRARAAMAG